MTLLDRKLLRDLRALRTQALAVALVMACGIAMLVNMRSLIRSLETARDAYYRENRFAHVFASLKRAPASLAPRLAALPGVAAVETGVALQVTLDLPGRDEPATGFINTLPDRRAPVLDLPHLRAGRWLDPLARDEVLVGEAFAEANSIKPGDTLSALLNGRKVALRVAGVVLAPQYVFEAPPGSALPDNRTFGVLWMREEELAQAYRMDGAFNTAALALGPGADERAVIAGVDRLLGPYGGLGAYGRADHPSDIRVSDEIKVLRKLSLGFPLVFLGVAAFMVHSVLSRQIVLQREQIAILKAFGFSGREVSLHFLKFAFAIVLVGAVLGTAGGVLLGRKVVVMYHLFFRFPELEFRLAWGALIGALLVSAAAAFLGTLGAARRVMRLAPAQAMRPEPPASFRPALFERTGLTGHFTVSLRMALRNLERKPWRSVLTCAALALATGILVIPNAFLDGLRHVLDFQWDIVQRQTVTVSLVEPGPARGLSDLAHLPGVTGAEPFRRVPVELVSGHRTRRLAVTGLGRGSELQRVTDSRDRPAPLPPAGIVLSRVLADALGLAPGDTVRMRALTGRRAERDVVVAGLAEDFAGIAAYMDLGSLNRLLGEGDLIDGASLMVAGGSWRTFLRAVKETPQAAGVVVKSALRESFRKTTAESIGLIQGIYLVFSTVVAAGIVYNSARISLSERTRELATLRVLGFGRREVGASLVIELVLLTAAALPLGLAFGSFLAGALLRSVNTETVRLPLVLTSSNYATAVLVVSIATAVSAALACRRLDKLDLVSVLKAPE